MDAATSGLIVLYGIVVATELDQSADHVQPVLELVLLRA